MPARQIDLPLVSGVREDLARELLPDGMLRTLKNYRVEKPGKLVRRGGYVNASGNSIYKPATSTAKYVSRLWSWRGQQLGYSHENVRGSSAQGDWGLFLKQDASTTWKICGSSDLVDVGPIASAPLPVHRVRTLTNPAYESAASVNGYTMIVWINSDTSYVGYELRNADGGVFARSDTLASATEATCFACGSKLLMFYRNGASLYRREFDTSSDTVLSGATTVDSALNVADPAWDASADGSNDEYIVCWHDNGNTVSVASYNASHSQQGSDTIAISADLGLACARYGSTASIVLCGENTGGTLKAVMYNGEVSNANEQAPVQLEATFTWDSAFTCSANADGYWAAWSYTDTPTGYTIPVKTIKHCTLNPAGPSKGTVREHPHGWVGSKPHGDAMWVRYSRYPGSGPNANQLSLWNGWGTQYPRLIAQAGYGVVGPARWNGGDEAMPIAGIAPDGAGNLLFAADEFYGGDINDVDGSSNPVGERGVVVHRWSMTSGKVPSSELGGLHVVGGRHACWDGVHLVDSPICHPDADDAWASNNAGGGGSIAAGTYYYKVLYSITDAAGNIWRSPVSPTITEVVASGTSTVTIRTVCPGTQSTYAELYRLHTDNTWRYVDRVNLPSTSITADLTDDGTLTLGSQPLLYTAGNEPESYPTPPSDVCAVWNRRLFVASGDAVYYSHSFDNADGSNLAPWMVETFRVQMTADVTALVALDSSLLIFTESTIHMLTGDGPNRLGQNTYLDPQRISSEVGCVDWRGVAEFRGGVMWRSVRGLELIPRGAYAVQPVGDQVEDTLADYTTTTSAVVIPEDDEIRWTVRSSTGGRIIVYNYVSDVWSVETAPCYDGAADMPDGYTVWSNSAAVENAAVAGYAWEQDGTQWVDDDGDSTTTAYTSELETGDIRGSGPLGWQSLQVVNLLGRLQAQSTIEIAVALDGENDFDDAASATHYMLDDTTTDYTAVDGGTYTPSTGVLAEDNSSGAHRLRKTYTMGTTEVCYVRAELNSIGRESGVFFGSGSPAVTVSTTGVTTVYGSPAEHRVTDLGSGSYRIEMWAVPPASPMSVGVGGYDSGSSSYTGDSRDICTIDELVFGYEGARGSDAPLRQEFVPEFSRCEAARVRVRDASTTQGAELTALRLDVKPKRKAGRLGASYRSS